MGAGEGTRWPAQHVRLQLRPWPAQQRLGEGRDCMSPLLEVQRCRSWELSSSLDRLCLGGSHGAERGEELSAA